MDRFRPWLSFAIALFLTALPGALHASENGTLTGCAFRTDGVAGGDRVFVLPIVALPKGCRPAAGATLSAVGAGGAAVSAAVGTGGAFSLSVPAGSYVFRAQLTGLTSAAAALTVGPGQSVSVTAGDPPSNVLWVTDAQTVDPTHVDVLFSGSVAGLSSAAFTIRPPLAVLGASGDGSSRVRLTTAPQSGGVTYSVAAANLRATDGRVLDPTHASALFPGIGTGTQVVDAVAVDPMHVDIRFSAPILADSATSTSNYSFSPGLQVIAAAVLDGGRRVRLVTSEQSAGVLYTAHAYGVHDATGASLSYGSSAPFVGLGQGPQVLSAQSLDDTHVEVRFDEEVDPYSLQAGNFTIPGLPVLEAVIVGDARVVRLATPEQRGGATCRVLVSGVRDRVGNVMGASYNTADFAGKGTPPSLVSAYAVDSTHVELAFSEPLDPASLPGVQAQFTPALTWRDPVLQPDPQRVRLAVTEMLGGGSYTVSASGVRDRAGNAIAGPGAAVPFTGMGVAPRLLSAWVVDTTHVDARYSEPVQAAGTYSTAPYLNVTGAAVQPDGVTVRLTTAEMSAATPYTLYASGVTDRAGNALDPSSTTATFGGAGGAPTVVSAAAVESVTVDVLFSEAVTPASAQAVANYAFSPALSISFAQLQGDGRTVRLTTSEQKGGAAYQVTASNVQDTAGNVVAGAGNRAAFTGIGVPPTLSTAVAVDSTHVDLSLSEGLGTAAAALTSNYALNPPLAITAAVLQPDGLTVRLTTSEQRGGESYTVSANNLADLVGNVIGAGNSKGFTGIGVAPTVVSANVVDSTTLEVHFSEAVLSAGANLAANYAVSPSLAVSAAVLQGDGLTVRLTTSEQKGGENYTVAVTGVKDLAGNLIGSGNTAACVGVGVPPTAVSATPVDSTTVDVRLSEALLTADASTVANYSLTPGLAVSAAVLQGDGKTVRLTTAEQKGGQSYTVTVSGVKDLAGNTIGGSNTAGFTGIGAGPTVVSAAAVNSTTVDVLFSEAILPTDASLASNYALSLGLGVSAAALQGDGRTVRLTTAEQLTGQAYTVGVANVRDLVGNLVGTPNSAAFTGVGVAPTVTSATPVDSTTVDVLFSEAVESTTANTAGAYAMGPSLVVSGAALQGDGRTVRLTTAEQKGGESYTVTVTGVKDVAGNTVGGSNTATFTGIGVAPTVVSATAIDSTTVDVLFSEAVLSTDANVATGYTLSLGLGVSAAVLQGDGRTVRLTTSEQLDGAGYTVTVTGVHDLAGNLVGTPSSAPFTGVGVAPTVASAAAVNSTTVDVVFGEGVLATDANVTGRYLISPALTVSGAVLQGDGKTVRLTTTEQKGGESYTVTVANVRDLAGNTIATGNTAAFTGIGVAPTVASATVVNSTTVDVRFSEDVLAANATVTGNYSISPSLAVSAAVLQGDAKTVRLTTAEQQQGQSYTVTVSAVRDLVGNPIGTPNSAAFTGAGVAPTVTSATPVDSTTVDVLFSEAVESTTANTAGGYSISPSLAVSGAALQGDGKTVRLTTPEQKDGESYTVTVTGVKDTAGNTIGAGNTATFTGTGVPPAIASATVVDARTVDVLFDEAVDATSANDAASYSITPPLAVSVAALQGDGKTVRLTTAFQTLGTAYALTAPGVKDPAGNACAGSKGFTGHTPTLLSAASVSQVGGAAGSSLGIYRYQVTYTSMGDAAPASVQVTIKRPDLSAMGTYDMVKVTPSDTTYSDGCDYQLSTPVILGPTGGYTFEVNATDGTYAAAPLAGSGPTLSAIDSRRWAYASGSPLNLYVMDSNGAGQARLTNVAAQDALARWSPDASRIAFTSERDGNREIYVMDADGANQTRLTNNSVKDTDPVWSPDGGTLAFASEEGGWGIFLMNPDGTNVRRLTTCAQVERAPAWSPDGSRIAFESQRDGNYEIYVMNADGTGVTRAVTNAAWDSWPVWSPDGTQIAFWSDRDGVGQAYVMNPDGSGQTRLATSFALGAAGSEIPSTWSADGSALIVNPGSANASAVMLDGTGVVSLGVPYVFGLSVVPQAPSPYTAVVSPQRAVLVADGASTLTVAATVRDGGYRAIAGATVNFSTDQGSITSSATTNGSGVATATLTAGSTTGIATITATASGGKYPTAQAKLELVPPGRVIYYTSRDGNMEVYRIAADGSADTRLTTNATNDKYPRWSPDGNRVAFVSERDGNDEIYVMGADGSNQTRLTSNSVSDTVPAWSPDGIKIAFTSNRDGNYEIYVMNADGTGQTRVTNNAGSDDEPTWSADGSQIAFISNRDGNDEIYTMDASGANQTRLTTSTAADAWPCWSPDGASILFSSLRDGNDEIYVMGANGSGQTRLTNNAASDQDPKWSPDGAYVLFTSDRAGASDLYVMLANGTRQTQVTTGGAGYYCTGWAPVPQAPSPYSAAATTDKQLLMADGASTATVTVAVRDGSYLPLAGAAVNFSTDRGSITSSATTNGSGVATATLTAGTTAGTATITATVSGGQNPTCQTKAGLLQGRIAFMAMRDGNWEIYRANADGSMEANLTANATADAYTRGWSPDGNRVAFRSDRDGNSEIYSMNDDGTGLARLTNNTAYDDVPSWSPDGARIAFYSNRDGNNEIYTMSADGSSQTRLTNNTSDDSNPTWSPDGMRIVFNSGRDGNTEIYTMNADGSGQTRLTNNTVSDRWPCWSPDGLKIAFATERDGNGEIYVMNADGGSPVRLTNDAAADDRPFWSPDGGYIAFQSDRTGGGDIYVMRRDGMQQTRITTDASADLTPAWGSEPQAPSPYSVQASSDKPFLMADGASTATITVTVRNGSYQAVGAGTTVSFTTDNGSVTASANTNASGQAVATYTAGSTAGPATITATVSGGKNPVGQAKVGLMTGRIAFESNRSGNQEIYVMNADGGGPANITNDASYDMLPAWSPDGSRVAFVTNRDGNNEIYVMNSDGANPTRLTNNGADDSLPAWSPDGSTILWCSNRDNNSELYAMRPDGGELTRLTNSGANDGAGVWSPDGSRIAFTSDRDGNTEIYVMNRDGSGLARVTNNTAPDEYPVWSPDGARLAFQSDRSNNTDIYLINADGSGEMRLTTNMAPDRMPGWSPDGAMLTFSSERDGNEEIYLMRADGTGQTRLTSDSNRDCTPRWGPAPQGSSPYSVKVAPNKQVLLADEMSAVNVVFTVYDGGYRPVVGATVNCSTSAGTLADSSLQTITGGTCSTTLTSPANTGTATITAAVSGGKNPTRDAQVLLVPGQLAFCTNRDGQSEVYRMYGDGNAPTNGTNNTGQDYSPSWSPDASRIAFATERDGQGEVYVMNADGSGPTNLTSSGASDYKPAWSPDGSRIAFESDRDGQYEVYVMKPDGTGLTRLTRNTYSDGEPAWSPDGKRIAFVSDRDGNREVYVMRADGTSQTRLTHNKALESEPAWSPDGSRIAFVSDRDGTSQIYVMNADGSGQTRLTNNAVIDTHPTWSPDGAYIGFISNRDGDNEVCVMRADGTFPVQLTANTADEGAVTWGTLPQDASPFSVAVVTDKSIATTGGTCTITAQVRDGGYKLLGNGIAVTFSATVGTLGDTTVNTTAGVATTTFTAPGTAGTAVITATVSGGKNPTGSTKASFVGQGRIAYNYGVSDSIYVVDADGANDALLLANPASTDGTPLSWSPDGASLVFASNRDGNEEIYSVQSDGSNLTRLTANAAADVHPAWAPDGARVAFASARDGNLEVYAMRPDGTDLVRLTSNTANDDAPSWSRDGTRIAFESERDGNYEIYVMDADGSNQTRLTTDGAWDRYPAWSPDGTKIAFYSTRDSGNLDIYVMNADGSGQTRLTTDAAIDGHATWLPDGSKIAFHSSRDGHYELYTMNADGGGQARLTTGTAARWIPSCSSGLGEGAYSVTLTAGTSVILADGMSAVQVTATVRGGHYEPRPNATVSFATDKGILSDGSLTTDGNGQAVVTLSAGDSIGPAHVTAKIGTPRGDAMAHATVRLAGPGKICYHSNQDGDYEIFVMDPDGANVTQLTNNSSNDMYPTWSADGTKIAWEADRDGNIEIYSMNADGTGQTRLTNTTADDGQPNWSPDGSKVIYMEKVSGCWEIFTMNANGSAQAQLTTDGPTYTSAAPCYSPDGTRIAYQSNRISGTTQIWVMKADGSGKQCLTSSGESYNPDWSQDGTKICFTTSRTGNYEIYRMNADGGNPVQLTSHSASDMAARWSPDGTRIVWTSARGGNGQVYVMNSYDGSSPTNLTNTSSEDGWPSWSRGTDPQTGRTPIKAGPRTRTRNARLRAYCNGQEAFALLTPLGVVPEGRADGLIATGEESRDPGPETRDRTGGRDAETGTAGPESSALRFVALTGDEAAAAGLGSRVSGLSSARSWSFALEAPAADAEITLSWPDLSGLGAKERVMLEDLDGAKRRSMRTTAGYTFRSGAGARRRFRVTADPRTGPSLLVTGLQLLSADGGARSPGNALRTVRFNVSTEASVDIRLLAPAGREVAVLAHRYAAAAGQNQLSWRGALSSGLYLMEATATTDDGTAVKRVQPVVVVR